MLMSLDVNKNLKIFGNEEGNLYTPVLALSRPLQAGAYTIKLFTAVIYGFL
jgi:hypothetical protein